MSAITNSAEDALCELRAQVHSNCVVCSPLNDPGLRLDFSAAEDGSGEARFDCDRAFEGCANVLHGGTISWLLDGAMTNCLFAHGHPGATVELTVRSRHLVRTGGTVTMRAWIERLLPRLHVLKAKVVQGTQVKAAVSGKLMQPGYLAGAGLAQ